MKLTPNLIEWQRKTYATAHKDKWNLVIHGLTAPVFVGGILLLFCSLVAWTKDLAALSFVTLLVVVVIQGFGHSLEGQKPVPFRSPLDFVARLFVENTFTFWRFFFSGEYARALWESFG